MRRTSSSYKHLKTNSLVSNSPFKSLVTDPHHKPTTPSSVKSTKPSTGLGHGSPSPASSRGVPSSNDNRRLSADVHVQLGQGSEHEDPVSVSIAGEESSEDEEALMTVVERRRLDFKRESKRRQSAGLAGLSSKSKVTNSPFLQSPSMDEALSPDTIPNPSPLESISSVTTGESPSIASATSFNSPPRSPQRVECFDSNTSPAPTTPSKPASTKSHLSDLAKQTAPPSPSPKSSLKSRRLRGPRLSKEGESSSSLFTRRERRKTVTFTERPEVSFFEKDANEQDVGSYKGSEDEYGGEEYEHSYAVEEGTFLTQATVEMGREESNAFEFEEIDGAASPLPLFLGEGHDYERQQSSLPADDSYHNFTIHASQSIDDPHDATDNFVSSLLEDDFLSPASISSPVFLGPTLDVSVPSSPFQDEPLAPVARSTLPTLPASAADPILLNGNILEPSTHLSYGHQDQPVEPFVIPTVQRASGVPPTASPSALSSQPVEVSASGLREAHAHQAGPLPDPFLTISTVQNLFSPPKPPKGGIGLGLPAGEGGVPSGRSHHTERQQAVKELRRGVRRESQDSLHSEAQRPLSDAEDPEVEAKDFGLLETRSSLVASRGKKLPEIDVFGVNVAISEVKPTVSAADLGQVICVLN